METSDILSLIALIISGISLILSLNNLFQERANIKIQILNVKDEIALISSTLFLRVNISNISLRDISVRRICIKSDKSLYIAKYPEVIYNIIKYKEICDIHIQYHGTITIDCYFKDFNDFKSKKLNLLIDTPIKSFKLPVKNKIIKAHLKAQE